MGAEEDRRADRSALCPADGQPHVRGAGPVRAGGGLAGQRHAADRPRAPGARLSPPRHSRRRRRRILGGRRRPQDRPVRQRRHQHRPQDVRVSGEVRHDGSDGGRPVDRPAGRHLCGHPGREKFARSSAAPIISSSRPTRRAPPTGCSWRAAAPCPRGGGDLVERQPPETRRSDEDRAFELETDLRPPDSCDALPCRSATPSSAAASRGYCSSAGTNPRRPGRRTS